MSINITVHGSPFKRSTKTMILLDPEGSKKQLLEDRRKLRLEQVRQKSKEFASQVRRKVDNEKQKQLKKIEQIKKKELENWKKKVKTQLNDTIPEIGEAHRAANKELKGSNSIFYQINSKESLDLIPAVLNKNISKSNRDSKRIPSSDDKENNDSNIIRSHSYPDVVDKSEDHTSSFDEMISKKSLKKSEDFKAKNTKLHNYSMFRSENDIRQGDPNFSTKTNVKKSDTSKRPLFSSFHEPNLKSYALFKESQTKLQFKNLKKTPSVVMSVGSSDSLLDSSSSSLEIQDIHDQTNRHFSRIYSKEKEDLTSGNYNSKNFSEPSEQQQVKTSRIKFTKISDFLNKNQLSANTVRDSNEDYTVEKQSDLIELQKKTSENINQKNKTKPLNIKNTKSVLTEHLASSNIDNSQRYKSSDFKIKQTLKKDNQFESESIQKTAPKISIVKLSNIKPNAATSYDYNNRFQKTINPTKFTTVTDEKSVPERNAIENADIERQLQMSKEKELEIMRKKTEERGQKALEREKVRRDYEMLEAKLEALTKDRQLPSFSNMRENISEVRLKQMENERINKINSKIENVIRRPVVITLPEVDQNVNVGYNSKFEKKNPTTGINLANLGEDSGTINSSDSCCSILLNYVDNQAKQINRDIQNSNNNNKSQKLKELLNKLEHIKANLLKELEKSEKSTENKNIQTMFDSISDLREEREKIMLLNTEKKDLEKREKELKKREVILEKKLLEFYNMKKDEKSQHVQKQSKSSLPEQIKPQDGSMNVQYNLNETSIESSSHSEETQDESSECIEKKVVSINKPMEIVIKVKEAIRKTNKKKASLIQNDIQYHKKYNFHKMSTPVKNTEESEGTGSTIYRSPPDILHTKLGEKIDKDIQFNNELNSTRIPGTDKAAVKCREEILKEIERVKENDRLKAQSSKEEISKAQKIALSNSKKSAKISKLQVNDILQSKKSTGKNSGETKKIDQSNKVSVTETSQKPHNSVLAQYIQRLLGMSRHSINMLGVSSSDIETPSSSIVNVSHNLSPTELNTDQQERIKRIQNFINDNYSFVNEIEESLRREEKSNTESEESVRLIEEIWKKSLKHKTNKIKLKDVEAPKPILKKKLKTQKTDEIESKKIKTIDKESEKQSTEEKVLERYTELTDNCTQRIAELNEMIGRVRKEKQKILEITLSSNGGGNSETEYLDFIIKSKHDKASEPNKKLQDENSKMLSNSKEKTPVSKILDNIPPINSIPETPNKEAYDSIERVQLEKNKLTGVSRDSGISLSRPLTALDQRDSPDIRDKTEDTNFEPFLKDIPKPSVFNMNKSTVVSTASISITKQVSITANPNVEHQLLSKKTKPPASISRYSPQLVEDIPHELSTIFEIDTPATSRLNTTIKDSNIPIQHDKIVEEKEDQQQESSKSNVDDLDEFSIDFRKYPTFEDYAKAQNMDFDQFDADKSAYVRKLYEELFELTQSVNINLKKFPSISSFQKQEDFSLTNQSDQDSFMNLPKELTMKKFLTPKEYFKNIGATELLDSKSFIDNTQSKSSTLKDLHGNTSSGEEFSKEWCLKKFPELKEYLIKAGISNRQEQSCDKTILNNDENANEMANLTKANSEESLPDVNAELKRRNIMKHSFKNQIFAGDEKSEAKISSSSDPTTISSSSKENKDPNLFIKPKSTNDISGIEAISHEASSHSSNELGKEFEQMGLKWASLMLKKQQESKALSSSTSSSFTFQRQDKTNFSQKVAKDVTIKSHEEQPTDKNVREEHQDSTNTTFDDKFGKPLNLREFLMQEFIKRTNSSTDSATSLVEDSLASLFLRSLIGSATATSSPKNRNDNGAAGSSDRQQKTSTPVLIEGSSKSSSSLESNRIKLFSGESRISSVRFNSDSYNLSSNDDNDNNDKNLKSKNSSK